MPRTKQFDRQETLQKAVELFWTKGFHATSMQDIVDSLGINRASLYDTYGDKHTLFMEALTFYQQYEQEQLTQALNSQNNIRQFVEDLLARAVEESSLDSAHKGCFLVNTSVDLGSQDEQANELITRNIEEFVNKFAKFFKEAQQSGLMDDSIAPKARARYLYAVINGIRVLARSNPDTKVLSDVAKTAMQAF